MGFIEDAEGAGWRFDAEEMTGLLDPRGERHGVKSLTHRTSGLDVVHEKYDLLNLFLLSRRN